MFTKEYKVEKFTSYEENGLLKIKEYPDAKIVQINSGIAQQLADYTLHREDLEFSRVCLEKVNTDNYNQATTENECFWRSSIIHYIKCFGQNTCRNNLDYKHIHKDNDLAQRHHEYFRNLRDKHIAHDENSFLQCYAVAALNIKDHLITVENILGCGFRCTTFTPDNVHNLSLLIYNSHLWVEQKFQFLREKIKAELEKQTHGALCNMPEMRLDQPRYADVDKKKKRV